MKIYWADLKSDMKNTPLTWSIEKRKVKDLKPASYNPRKMSESEERDLGDSIDEFGAVIPVVVNIGKRNNILIGGHQRCSLYEKKGIEEIDVIVPSRELTITEEKRLNLRLNKNTGSWDQEKLRDMGLTLLLDVGFGDEDLQVFFDDVDVIDDNFDMKKAVMEIKNPKAKQGDVYILGEHKLMCGRAEDINDVQVLMAGEHADMVINDPPTSLKNEGHILKPKKEKKDKGDYAAFIDKTIENALVYSKPNMHLFYWTTEKDIWLLQTLMTEHKVKSERVLMWIKSDMTITPKVAFNKAYDPVVYGAKGKPFINTAIKNLSQILNKEIDSGNQIQEDVWEYLNVWIDKSDREGAYDYTFQKPVTLLEKPLKRCTAPGHIVMDLFGGAGSTIIACEQLHRKCRMMEQDPVMVDVIIRRWEEFTNSKAKKI